MSNNNKIINRTYNWKSNYYYNNINKLSTNYLPNAFNWSLSYKPKIIPYRLCNNLLIDLSINNPNPKITKNSISNSSSPNPTNNPN